MKHIFFELLTPFVMFMRIICTQTSIVLCSTVKQREKSRRTVLHCYD